MNPLKINITGVRGIVGGALTPLVAVNFTQAFATYSGGGEIFLCNDARNSAAMMRSAAISGLLAAGCTPVDFGVCPTPSMQFATASSDASGAIAISGGHNSEEWNALRFIRSDGMYLNEQQGDELLDVYHSGEFKKAQWNEIAKIRHRHNAFHQHIERIAAVFGTPALKKRKPRVVVDTCNGGCSEAAPRLLEKLGCRVICIHNEPGRAFPHDPEPSPGNMQPLGAIVTAADCDIGFMLDTAGERLGIVTNLGHPLPEEMTLPLCALIQMKRKPGPVVTNFSTTRAVDDIARSAGAKVIRTPIGQAYVAEAAMKNRAAIGGEGSGGVIIPGIQYNNDSLAAMAFILDGLAAMKTSASALVDSLPTYIMKKKKVDLDSAAVHSAVQRARTRTAVLRGNPRISLDDGLKAEWKDSWLHIRPSNTEPLVRIISEATTEARAEKLVETGTELISL